MTKRKGTSPVEKVYTYPNAKKGSGTRKARHGPRHMAGGNEMETLAQSLSRLADNAGLSASALQRIANNTGAGGLPSDAREEVIIGWGIALGTLRKDNRGITFLVDMYTLDGAPNGTAIVTSETTIKDPMDLVNPPPTPPIIPADPNPVE